VFLRCIDKFYKIVKIAEGFLKKYSIDLFGKSYIVGFIFSFYLFFMEEKMYDDQKGDELY
jgi:hypothetical protein